MALGRNSKSSSGGGSGSSGSSSSSDRAGTQLRALLSGIPANKMCFDCGQRGPTYINMTAGTFVCTKCSGMLRGITPPHRIKSLSMSSFTSEEVEWMRNRGNGWAAKVWMGLLDEQERERRRTDAMKDGDEAVKQFIIDKYEKKRFYVDAATVKPDSPSTALPPPTATNGFSKGQALQQQPKMIGSTLTARMSSRGDHGSSAASGAASASSSAIGRPGGAAAANGKPSASTSSGILADFGSTDLFAPSNNMSLSASAGPISTNVAPVVPAAVAPQPAATGFANFDAANFDTPADPLSSVVPAPRKPLQPGTSATVVTKPMATTGPAVASAAQTAAEKSAADRYAALKDLDDLFKTSVVVQDAVPSSQSTGVSLFGSSPVQAASAFPPAANAASPPPAAPVTATSPFAASAATSTTDWATNWNQPTQQTKTEPGPIGGPSPVNPFTGASNLTQLNTSPWPTTGSSPINNHAVGANSSAAGGFAQWPQQQQETAVPKPDPDPFATSNLQAGNSTSPPPPTFDAFLENISHAVDNNQPKTNNNNNPWTASFGDAPAASTSPEKFTAAMKPAHNPTNPFL